MHISARALLLAVKALPAIALTSRAHSVRAARTAKTTRILVPFQPSA